ncbi:MAG: Acetyl esterase/lipase [Chloroflexi bacterium]|jgi:acetyl esterase/lipase|nr:MAG: Acetyl esterase/lipase [Chloroflexota bacterium]
MTYPNDPLTHSSAPSGAQQIEITRDILVAVHGGVELKADLYSPAGPGPFPAIILIFGGGWQRGSKEQWLKWGPFFAEQGVVAFAISYRLSAPGKPSLYESMDDVRSGVQYLRGRAAELKVDPEHIGGMGVSAGGHLVAMLALAGDDKAFIHPSPNEPYSSLPAKLNVAIPAAGIFDMIQQWEHDLLSRTNDNITEKYLGGTPMSHRELFYLSSPLYYASTENAQGTQWLIPYGTYDDVVDHQAQSITFSQHLKRAGATVRQIPLLGANHFWVADGGPDEGQYNPTFVADLKLFLRNWLTW